MNRRPARPLPDLSARRRAAQRAARLGLVAALCVAATLSAAVSARPCRAAEASGATSPAPVVAQSDPARATTPHRLEWRWPRFGALDYAATALLAGGYLWVELFGQPAETPRWRGGILFDESVRGALVGGSRASRDNWAVASDVLALIPQGMMVVDSLLVPLLTDRGNTDVALQTILIAAQGEAIAGLLSRSGHFYVARARPDREPCFEDPNYSASCGRGSTAGFPGGHAAGAFVGAGVVCVHHWHLPLYGGGFWDAAACAGNLALATATGYSRIVADRHYLTDTLTGMAIGAGAGFFLPWLLHYRSGSAQSAIGSAWLLTPWLTGDATGLGARGSF